MSRLTASKLRSKRWAERARAGAASTVAFVRRHWILSITAALLLVFVIAPGLSAAQPEFYRRFTNLSGYYDSWSRSHHSRVPCQDCHVPPSTTSQASYHVRATGEIYLSLLPLSREPSLLTTPTIEACDACHIDLREVSPSGDLNIPHKAHVEKLKINCAVCHDRMLVHASDETTETSPRMGGCLTCHDGEKAKDDCEACHREKDQPKSHEAKDWLVVHSKPLDAKAEAECKGCHAWSEKWCTECHIRRPRSHGSPADPSKWRKEHAEAIRVNRNCEACHEGTFCDPCHGEVPQLNFDPALELVKR